MAIIVDELDLPHLGIMPAFYPHVGLIVELDFWSIVADTRQADEALCKALRYVCIGASRNHDWPIN